MLKEGVHLPILTFGVASPAPAAFFGLQWLRRRLWGWGGLAVSQECSGWSEVCEFKENWVGLLWGESQKWLATPLNGGRKNGFIWFAWV